jgi:transposase
MIDATIVKVHKAAAGARGGSKGQAIGRSRGGLTTKIHLKTDEVGVPIRCILTAGQKAECEQAENLVAQDDCTHLIADRGYDSDQFRNALASSGINSVIPGRRHRKIPINVDEEIYKKRNVVERFFSRIKEFRRIATRYEKNADLFRAMFVIGCIVVLLKV